MKFKVTGLLLVGMLAMGACSAEETATGPKEVEAEAPKEEPKEDAPEAEPVKSLSASEQEYGDFMINVYQQLPSFFDEITALSTDAVNDPMLILENSWREDIVLNYELMTALMQQIKDFENVPPLFQESHSLQVKAADEFIASKEKFYDGIDNMDATLITEAAEHMSAGSSYIKQAQTEIEAITAEMGN